VDGNGRPGLGEDEEPHPGEGGQREGLSWWTKQTAEAYKNHLGSWAVFELREEPGRLGVIGRTVY